MQPIRTKWLMAGLGFGLTASILMLRPSSHMPLPETVPTIGKSSFSTDPERGLIAPVPAQYATFMGHPISIVVDRGGFSDDPVTKTEINQANAALKHLPGCVREAEAHLLKYAGDDMVQSGNDIQNPHVWLSGETDDPADWTLVVEQEDNDGYGWHIEFHGNTFKTIWSGS